MRAFHELVFDEVLVGTDAAYTSPAFDDLLGLAESLTISGYAARATGTDPTIAVYVEDSPDHMHWWTRANPIGRTNLDTTQDTAFGGGEGLGPYATPRQAFARLNITLGGTSPMARVVIWVTGRAEWVVRDVGLNPISRSVSTRRAASMSQLSARAQLASQAAVVAVELGTSGMSSSAIIEPGTSGMSSSAVAVPQLLPSALSPDGVAAFLQSKKGRT